MKKLFSIFLILSLSISVLSGCGVSDEKLNEALSAIGTMEFTDELTNLSSEEVAEFEALKAKCDKAYKDRDLEALEQIKTEWENFKNPIENKTQQAKSAYQSIGDNSFLGKNKLTDIETTKVNTLVEKKESAYKEKDLDRLLSLQQEWSSLKEQINNRIEEEKKVKYETFSYTTTDSSGYTFELTFKVSPWILYSNTEIINSVWSEIGKGNQLPTSFGSWGLKIFANDQCVRQNYDAACFGGDNHFGYTMTDMYYCLGSVKVKNITNDWKITSSQPYSPDFYLPCIIDNENNYSGAHSIGRVFYTESQRDCSDGVKIDPQMTSDSWGPVSFIIMTPEYFSPKSPNGAYFENVRNGFLWKSPLHFSGHKGASFNSEDNDRLYLGIYGKDGVYTPPIVAAE